MDGSEPDIRYIFYLIVLCSRLFLVKNRQWYIVQYFSFHSRIIMCMFCGDPYSVENVLGPLLNHQCCFLSGERSIILETFLGDSKRKVEVIISSYHGANAFRDDLVHGFILVYSSKRKASLATLKWVLKGALLLFPLIRCFYFGIRLFCWFCCLLNRFFLFFFSFSAFSMNIPNLPIQIMAVTDSGGANAFFSSDLSHLLMTEGNAVADRLQAHFMTSSSSCQQKSKFSLSIKRSMLNRKATLLSNLYVVLWKFSAAFYTPFFKEVWDKKPEIEQAFNMEEPPGLSRSAECTLEVRPGRRPRPPPRLESYHCKGGSNDGWVPCVHRESNWVHHLIILECFVFVWVYVSRLKLVCFTSGVDQKFMNGCQLTHLKEMTLTYLLPSMTVFWAPVMTVIFTHMWICTARRMVMA